MDVPFISSGAMSRAHYAIVRKVESATSIPQADQALHLEIKSIREQLAHPNLTLKQRKERLIILLYCSMTVTSGFLPTGSLEFALPHALNLAEAGHTVQDKRIGYLFCDEIMPRDHELQLMLVNTLRKDLESTIVARICLALDILIASCNEAVIPAVQSRLYELLSHTYPYIRRRALLAFRSLARHDTDILTPITSKVLRRLKDTEDSVVNAALIVASDITKVKKNYGPRAFDDLIFPLSDTSIPTLLHLIHVSAKHGQKAVLLEAFQLLSRLSPTTLASADLTKDGSVVASIRDYLCSQDPNDQYLFFSCLECVDLSLWAGTSPDRPAVLEAQEVERVMQLLGSPDGLIRKKVLRVLNSVDSAILDTHYSQAVENIPPSLPLRDQNEYAGRLLEIIEIQSEQDGEQYARQVKHMLERLESAISMVNPPILETAVERILDHLRAVDASFRLGCATTLLTMLTEPETPIGPTLMVVIPALATEHFNSVAIPPSTLLTGFAARLPTCSVAVQDICVMVMLRLVADCEEVPHEIKEAMQKLRQVSGRSIQRRCDQFLTLAGQKHILVDIVHNARSSSLPDFAESLERYKAGSSTTSSKGLSPRLSSPSPSHSTASLTASKLRYTAYETPQIGPRLRGRRLSSSQRSTGSSRSGVHSDTGNDDLLSRTMTPGDLALAAGSRELETLSKVGPGLWIFSICKQQTKADDIPVNAKSPLEDASSRMDLITLDSPFISDPLGGDTEKSKKDGTHAPDFEKIWDSLADSSGARGWYSDSIDTMVRRLQGLDRHRLQVISAGDPPFMGEYHLFREGVDRQGEGEGAVVRVRESEEEGCLWRLRCGDAPLRIRIKRLLTEE
ncbi:armadillo-type protein [Crucibulum laeve]|uniref:Armadillo-type protein n=1 Tax=Crucibulum laeve TaxID=68775 RepID=A0A5C3MH16_9AGAR|nr:armadillo-type protein [Crucibulum laeve]